MKQESDLRLYNEGKQKPKPLRNQPDITPVNLPYDAPAYVRVHRLLRNEEQLNKGNRKEQSQRSVIGFTVEVDCFNMGVKVYVRIGRDGTLKVFAEDEEGTVKLEEWSK